MTKLNSLYSRINSALDELKSSTFVHIDDISDEVLIEEVEARGYKVIDDKTKTIDDDDFKDLEWCFYSNNMKELIHKFESVFPFMWGLSKKLKGKE